MCNLLEGCSDYNMEESVLFTSQLGVPDRLVCTLNEPPAAVTTRFSALLSDFLT